MNNQRMIRMLIMMLIRPVTRFLMRADSSDTSPEGRARQKQVNEISRRSRQAMRVTRRMGKL